MNSALNRKPAIWIDALQLATVYTLGSDLCRLATQVYRWVAQAARLPE